MKKLIFTTLIVTLFLVVPISVYAYSNNQNDNTSFTSDMMNGYNEEICTEPAQHQQFIQEQKLIIEQQLLDDEITREQADAYFNNLEEMLEFHAQHHGNSATNSMNCHN